MSKNMTRKGLALGTGLALVASMVMATPSQASTISTSVHLGTTTNVFAGGSDASNFIDLSTQLGSSTGDTLLKYRVLNPSGATLSFGASNDATAAGVGNVTIADGTNDYYSTATGAVIATATTTSTDFVVVPANFTQNEAGAASAYNILRIWATSANTASITVQAFLDTAAPGSHRMDDVETKGQVVTVNFYATADVTWTTTIEKPAATATELKAVVTTTPVMNTVYVTNPVTIDFTRQGSTQTITSASATANAARTSWSQTVNLDSSINWVGMPNWYQLASVSVGAGLTAGMGQNETETITYTLDADADLKSGDVFDIVGSTPAANNVSNGDVANYTYTANAKTLVRSSATGIASVAAEANSPAWLVVEKRALTTSIATTTVATYTTSGAHGLRVGDFVTIDSARDGIFERSTRVAVSAVPTPTTFSVALATAQTAATASAADTGLVTYDSFNRAAQGTYTAQARWSGSVRGNISDTGSINVAASTMNVSTTASANVQGIDVAGTGHTIRVKSGTLTTDVTLTVYNSAGAAVGAGRPVIVQTLTPTGPVTVNGRSTSGEVLLTDAKGQVKLTVASTTGTAGHQVAVTATAEGVATAGAGFTLVWEAATVGLVDLNTTGGQLTPSGTFQRKVIEDGSYELRLLAADQWFAPADSASHRLLVSGDGATGGVYPLTAGIATVRISDLDIASTWNTTVKLQRLVSGTWTDSATYTFASDDISSAAVALGADGSNAFGSTADLSDAVAEVALVEGDLRTRYFATPAYVNDLILNGRFTNSSSGVALEGVLVTVSGPSNILFENGNVDKRGSITVLTDASGNFEVKLFSTTAQTDSVITVTGLGVSATTRVTFTGIGAGEGTKLDVTAPANVRPASTFQVKALLADTFGNGVDTAANRIRVTYTGPGIVFGTLPNETDRNGELSFSVLLGSNDTGNVVVTVSYDQNGDGDFVDAKDLNTTKTITVGTGAASGAGKVNVGSFNGKLVVYAANLNGARISWKVGGNWGSAVASSNYSIFNRPTPRAGVTVNVEVFVNGVSTLTKSVVTR